MSAYSPAEGRRTREHDLFIDFFAWGCDEREPKRDPRDSEEYWESMGAFDARDPDE